MSRNFYIVPADIDVVVFFPPFPVFLLFCFLEVSRHLEQIRTISDIRNVHQVLEKKNQTQLCESEPRQERQIKEQNFCVHLAASVKI